MAIYAIGDLQGCFSDLRRLLKKLSFDPDRDRLWFCGDLVNRGPQSLECLRFVHSLGDAAVTVLGNHDLHLLARSEGIAPRTRSEPDLDEIIDAPDAAELLDWLRHRPLAHFDHKTLMIHAGLPPQWNLEQTMSMAGQVESRLRSKNYRKLLAAMYGDKPDTWDDALSGRKRRRFTINALTRLRYCDASGRMLLRFKGDPEHSPKRALPWFRVPGRASEGLRIVFGHWSTLGLHEENGTQCLDSACVWGGWLSAVRIDKPAKPVSAKCKAYKQIEPA